MDKCEGVIILKLNTMRNPEKIKIFLVDDDPMFVTMLKHSLARDKAEIKIFGNGEECLKSIDEAPEIVVLDYSLNNTLNGIQVLNKIKHSHPDTKVIMLSGQDNFEVINDTIKYGGYDYIAKSESAVFKIQKEVKQLCDELESTRELEKENKKILLINVAVIVVIITAYILSRLI